MRLADGLAAVAARLAEAGIEQPRREARLLAAHLLGQPAGALPDADQPVDSVALLALAARRAAREPLALITGRRGFWTLDLEVSAETLVPRPDSEAVVEAALAVLPASAAGARVLDLGTGTGCLLLAVLSERPGASGIGVDRNPRAAVLAARNAAACSLSGRAVFVAGDWADCLDARFDLVLCNPPYIETAALAGLMAEVRLHEPRLALDGGPDGLAAYARLLPGLPGLLVPGGAAILELGAGQGAAVAALASAAGLAHIATRPDLGGIPRALVLRRRPDKNVWQRHGCPVGSVAREPRRAG